MAVGRITGQMLNSTLNRVTTDLTIRSTGAANLLQIDTTNNRVGVATASPTVPLDVTGAIKGSSTITANTLALATGSITDSTGAISFGNENLTTTGQVNTSGVRLLENEITTIRSNDDLILSANGSGGVQIEGSLTVSADLTVNGSTTTVNSTTLTVDDKNIELAHSPSGASPSDTLADGGGITLKGSTDHTILWNNSTDDWDFSEHIDIASGKLYKVNGTEVLSGTTVTTVNAVHNVISSSDSSSIRITDGLQVTGPIDVSGSSISVGDINIGQDGITTDSNADLHITPSGSGNTLFSRSDNQIIVPKGNTSQRNGNIEGSLRYNTETGNFEGYSASGWGGLGGGDLTAVDDSSSSISVTLSQNSIKFAGGANITTSVSGTTITTALDTDVTGLTNLTVDNLNVNGNTITATSGDITLAPAANGDVNIGANLGLTFGDDGEKIEGDGTDLTISSSGKLNLTATSDVQIPANVGVLFGTGGEKIESDGTDLTATITGNFVFSGTTAIDVPVGTTGQRPTVNTGLIRFNSTLGVYEGSTDGSTYVSFLTAPAGEAADINKDVFTTSNDSTTNFALSFTPEEAQNVLVFVDNIFQESTNNYTVSGSTLTMTAALHNGARLVALHGFDGSGGVSGATWVGGTNTDVDSAIENVDTFTTSTFRSAEYTYVATNAGSDDDSTVGHETGKIMVVHDGTTALLTQFGITHTSTVPLLDFSVDISGGSVRLRAASAAANTGVRFARLGLAPL